MTDLIWTIIGAWVIWRIWSAFSNAGSKKNVVYEKHEHHHHHYQNNTSQQATNKKIVRDDEGEYAEFEEIKK